MKRKIYPTLAFYRAREVALALLSAGYGAIILGPPELSARNTALAVILLYVPKWILGGGLVISGLLLITGIPRSFRQPALFILMALWLLMTFVVLLAQTTPPFGQLQYLAFSAIYVIQWLQLRHDPNVT